MQFKLSPVEVPVDDPFRFDGLERRTSVEAISSLLDNLNGPFVLAIDSPWGTGKTTIVRMLKAFLELKGFSCLYFNAWETDFTTDPLIAFLGEMDQLMKAQNHKGKALEKTKKIATLIAKRVLPVAGKIATGGLLDLDSFTEKALAELVSDSVNDAVDAYSAEKTLIETFHKSLSEAIEKAKAEGKKANMVVFVDEVDRCRPTFAVELLERIKHLFNVQNILFVISLDKAQLSVSLAAIYGVGINSNEYLRRFIDLEYTLPKPNPKAFTRHLFARFGFEKFFAARTNNAFRYEREQLENSFGALSDLFDLSLRAREQCFTLFRVAMMTTPDDYYFYPLFLATLVVLKIAAPSAYKAYALENGTTFNLVSAIRQTNGGQAFLNDRMGITIEAYLVGARPRSHDETPEIESYKSISKDESKTKEERQRADQVIKIVTDASFYDKMPSLAYVTNKIELAAQFKD
jgi:hypothetical protein